MTIIPQISFLIIASIFGYLFVGRTKKILKNIQMGRPENRSNNRTKRLKNMALVAFGQKKMFKKPLPALLHLFIYVGFMVINLEVLEFVIDGLAGTHRIFAPYLGGLYTVCLNIFEFLALAVIVSCVVFLVRRNVLKLSRFWGEEMTSWPRLDANLILIIEILLMIAIFSMNATDQILQQKQAGYTATGSFVFSAQLIPLFDGLSTGSLIFIERSAWWIHIIGILGFSVYVTYSKHLHIFLAFPNTYFYNLETPGKMSNMPAVTHEVNLMLGVPNTESTSEPPSRFGAKDVKDLSRYNILNAYACTECGRCTSECPANLTGKKLSPRKIMMDVRDRAEELGNQKTVNEEDGKALLGDYISKEEIFACTSCNACVEACPVNIDPLSIILQLRRYTAMEESTSPAEWNNMFSNIETNFAPWKFASSDRFNWSKEL